MGQLEFSVSNGYFTYESKTQLITMNKGLIYVVCHANYGSLYIEKIRRRGEEPDVLSTNILEIPVHDQDEWEGFEFQFMTVNGMDTEWLRILVRDLLCFIDYINTYIKVLPRKY